MADAGFFFGYLGDAPAQVRQAFPGVDGGGNAETFVLHVPAGVRCSEEEALVLRQSASRLIVCIEAGGEAHCAVHVVGNSASHHTEVTLAGEARCTLLSLTAADASSHLAVTQSGTIGAGSSMRWQNVTIGAAHTEHSLTSRVIGQDGESAVDWMFYATGTEQQHLQVRNVFDARNGVGEILMRGIAQDKGHTECRGLIDIGLGGGGTHTYLTQEVLMLDATAKVDAVPGLEIKTNDVKASHSATVARVTEEDLFYFGARGIAPRDARKMFVLGFLGDITSRITHSRQREVIVQAIEEKYGNAQS